MNILVIHEVSYDSKVVYEYQDFAERLAARGHNVFVIDFDETGTHIKPPRKISRTGLGTVEVHSTPCINKPVLRFLTGRLFYPEFLRKFIRSHSISAIWMYSVFINGEKTIEIARAAGIPVVYRALDVYHQVRQNPLIRYPLLRGERYIYSNATHISVTNEKMGDYVRRLTGERKAPVISILNHGVDTDFFTPQQKDAEFSQRARLDSNSKVVLFLGTLYPFSGLDHLLKAFAKCKHLHPDIKFVVVGDGEQRPLLNQLVRELSLDNFVFFAGRAPYSDVPRWVSLADVTVTSFELNTITQDIVPIKSLQYLAMGKALVSAPIPDVMKLMPSKSSGVVYESIDRAEHFLNKALEIAENSLLSQRLGEKAREFVTRHFSVDRTVSRLESLLASPSALETSQ